MKRTAEALLTQIFQERQAVIFCGAGISIEPPAGLPDWHRLRDYTLQAVASKDEYLQRYVDYLIDMPMFGAPGKKGLTPEIVASSIVSNCDGYFESFRSLEDGTPNANHCHLAKMAKMGLLKYIVTTNFDLFIEQALQREQVNYRACRTTEEFARFELANDDFVYVLKIHGCISIPETITATVEQEGQGLPVETHRALEKLLSQFYFVFWGYSGADLKIDLDYLGMVSMHRVAKGFLWNFFEKPGYREEVNPYVIQLAQMYKDKAHITHGRLPQIFGEIVDDSEKIVREQHTEEQEQKWQRQKNQRLQSCLTVWAEKYLQQPQACNIFGSLLEHSGQMQHALECYQKFAETCRLAQNNRELAIAINNIGSIFFARGEYSQALNYYEQAAKIAEVLKDDKSLANDLNNIGTVYAALQNYEKALQAYRRAQQIAQQLQDSRLMATTFNNIGMVFDAVGNYDGALQSYQSAAQILKSTGNKKLLATALNNIAMIYNVYGDFSRALDLFREVQEIAHAIGDKRTTATALNNIGSILQTLGEYQQALERFKASFQLSYLLGDQENLAAVLNNIGMTHCMMGEHQEALCHYHQAQEIVIALGNKEGVATTLNNIGMVYKEKKDYAKAIKYYCEAEKLHRFIGDQIGLATDLNNIAGIYRQQQDYNTAVSYYEQALNIMHKIGDAMSAAVVHSNIAFVYQKMQCYQRAIEHYTASRDLYQKLQLPNKVAAQQKRITICQELYSKEQH